VLQLTAMRHGETEWNREKRFQGWLDSPLTTEGKAQVRARADALLGQHFDALISSDLGRALESAAIVSGVLGLPLARSFMEFREANFGTFGGCTREEAARIDPVFFGPGGGFEDRESHIPGAETSDDLVRRTRRGLRELLATYDGRHVLLVAHEGTLRSLREIFNVGGVSTYDNGGILTVEVDAAKL